MKDFELDPTLSLEELANENDLCHLLMHLWTQDTHIYPVELNVFKKPLSRFGSPYNCAAWCYYREQLLPWDQ